MNQLKLTGLDAQNPLAYFAALGLLRIVDYHARRQGAMRPLLAFVDEGRQVPILTCALDMDALIGLILEDAVAQEQNPALRLAYDANGRIVEPNAAGAIRDLKPLPSSARDYLARCATCERRTADLAAGFFSELVADRSKGNTKPTAFHFTAGQQAFLEMVAAIRADICPDDVREALFGPWTYESTLPSLSWDSSVTRLYALRAGDPSKEKRGSIPAAYLLAVEALAFYPVYVRGSQLGTPGVYGGWKDSDFFWPLWSVSISMRAVETLLRIRVAKLSARERTAMGISQVFSARITRSDQGGYGSFSPADVVLPSTRTSRSRPRTG